MRSTSQKPNVSSLGVRDQPILGPTISPSRATLAQSGGSFAPPPCTESNGRSATTGSPAGRRAGHRGARLQGPARWRLRRDRLRPGSLGPRPWLRRGGGCRPADRRPADHGLSRVIADTTLDNVASQRTLIRAGFRLVSTDAELHHYEVLLNGGTVRVARAPHARAASSIDSSTHSSKSRSEARRPSETPERGH